MNKKIFSREVLLGDIAILIYLTLLKLLLHIVSINNYGYFRDELYYIACSDHLALGYVDQPPLSIFILALARGLLGDSLLAIRFFSALACSMVVLITGLMARQLGGKRYAQILAALAVIAAPVILGSGRYFSMNAFDLLFWSLALYILILIIKHDNPKLWPLFGLIVGLGLLNKYSLLFFGLGLVGGLLLTSQRKHLVDKWFWLGGMIAFLIFLPHLIWEILHRFPTLEFMRNATQLKNMPISPLQFLLGQFLEISYFSAPIWLLGLYYFFFHKEGKGYQLFGWMYVLIFITLVVGRGKLYYLSPVYPVLLASGAVWTEKIILRINWLWLKPVFAGVVVLGGLIIAPFAIPILPVEVLIKYQHFLGVTPRQEERSELGVLPQHYADQFGWPELAAAVAEIYHRLSPAEQSNCLIFVRNYGEAAAIDFFGKKYHLPRASCGHNNYWLWGPPNWNGEVAIIFGDSREARESIENEKQHFEEVVHATSAKCTYCMPYENNRPLLLCRKFKHSIREIWPQEKRFL